MNFDKFKSVLPQKAQIDSGDTEYLQHLNSLKEPKQSNIWAMIGTIAAAVAIVAVVALWALIGRGLRGSEPIPAPPATEGVQIDPDSFKEYELTGELLYKIENAVLKPYNFTYIPLFNDKDPLSELKILEYYHILKPTAEINDFAKDLFNFEGKLHFDPEEQLALIIYEPKYKIQSIGECMLTNGQKMITVSYFMEGYDYTLAYIESTDFAVDLFFMHQKNGALAEGEVTVESEFQSIAKEYCFEQMYDFERGTIPDYTESKIYIARFAQTTLYENKNNKQIYAYPLEFYKSKMTEIFGGYEIPDEITPIDELTGPKYWMFGPIRANDGTLIVALDNESGMSYYFDFNSYAEGEYNGQKTITVAYTATDPYSKSTKKYAITYTTTDGVHPDKIIEKLEVSDTQIHYPNNYTEVVPPVTENFITREQAIKIAIEEAKKDKYDYQGWDSDFYFNDSEANTPILTSDKTYGNGFWVEEWYNEKCADKETVCWVVRLYDKKDPLTSLVLYIDGILGEVVGGAQLSD